MTKSKIMKAAWTIRKESAVKFGCEVSEVLFSECLRLAWAASKVVALIGGKIWIGRGIVRVYMGNGFAQIEKDGVNIDKIKSYHYSRVKGILIDAGFDAYRHIKEIR